MIAIGGAGADRIIVPFDRLCILLAHEKGIADPQHRIGTLHFFTATGAHEAAECGGRIVVTLHLEIGVAHAVAGLLVQIAGIGAR